MTYNRITDSTTAERAVCAVVFCLFVFVFVYFYQAPTLAYAQHVLSKGATVYHELPSALLVTFVLYLLQRLTLAATKPCHHLSPLYARAGVHDISAR